MEVPARLRTNDPDLDRSIAALVEQFGAGRNSDLVFEMLASVWKLVRDSTNRADMKLAARSLRELRYALRVFAPYADARKVAIFGSARTQPDDPVYATARDFAAAIAERGWMVITGAGPGVMAAGNEGAGAERSFGVNIRLPFEAEPNPFIRDDPKLVTFRYFFTRKVVFIKESSAFVLLPGGFGTMDECYELLTLIQTGKSDLHPIVMLEPEGAGYWESFRRFAADTLLSHGLIAPEDLDLFRITDSVEEAVDEVERFYRNYHSERYVDRRLVLRLRRAPDDGELEVLREKYADIMGAGGMEVSGPLPDEVRTKDNLELDRLVIDFRRKEMGRLRQLIDDLNRLPLDTVVEPAKDTGVSGAVTIIDTDASEDD